MEKDSGNFDNSDQIVCQKCKGMENFGRKKAPKGAFAMISYLTY